MFNRSMPRLALTASLTLAIGLASAAGASATTTIGQTAITIPSANCSGASSDLVQPTVTAGASYVVPAGGAAITSWTTYASTDANQVITMKVFRLVNGTTYQAVGHDGPRTLTSTAVQTFKTNVPVKPGDILGLSKGSGTSAACLFNAAGENGLFTSPFTDLQDGQSNTFGPGSANFRLNISAQVASQPSNDFSFGKVKKNKNKGTALLTVDVPGPGTLKLTGAGIKPQRSLGGATASKDVAKAGPVTLKIKAKGNKKAKLQDAGKVKVQAKVTFTPTGDLPGVPSTETKPVKLIDK